MNTKVATSSLWPLPVAQNAVPLQPTQQHQHSLVILYMIILTVSSVIVISRLLSTFIFFFPTKNSSSSTVSVFRTSGLRKCWALVVATIRQKISNIPFLFLHICDKSSLVAYRQYDFYSDCNKKSSLSTSFSMSPLSSIKGESPHQRVILGERTSTKSSHQHHPHLSPHCPRASAILTSSGSRSSFLFNIDLLWCAFLLLLTGLFFVPVSIRAAIRPSCRCVHYDDTYGKEYGIFTSPDWPTPYEDNTDCLLYTFVAPSDAIVEINFDEFDVQRNEEVG